ncbi:MAG: hypothetical protein WCG27_12915 [Pseudomonadota bacterium]
MSNILISGFSFIKNGLSLGYPIKESLESIEPLCDEIVINVGFDDPGLQKDDGTYQFLRDYFQHPKFIFLKSLWSPTPEGKGRGLVLSEQTNIALAKCRGKYCQYIQADETIHEEDLPVIHNTVMEMEENNSIQGLVFNYLHFYGNVDAIKYTRNIYRREVRLIRNHIGLQSWMDAQGFRFENGNKLLAKLIPARIFHYGWARQEMIMCQKVRAMDKLYHGAGHESDSFKYERIWGLKPFKKSHPKLMGQWINQHRNDVDVFKLPLRWDWENLGLATSDFIEKLTGYRLGEYRNYHLMR